MGARLGRHLDLPEAVLTDNPAVHRVVCLLSLDPEAINGPDVPVMETQGHLPADRPEDFLLDLLIH
jgi:hypothetical protein